MIGTSLTAKRRALLREFCRFGIVGLVGFLVDTAVVYGLREPLGLYGAGLLAYVVAATATWALNRIWTFAGRGSSSSAVRQWLLFLSANGLGAVLNRGTFVLLVWRVPLCATHPVLAIMAGVAAGLFVNFNMARRVVFPSLSSKVSPS